MSIVSLFRRRMFVALLAVGAVLLVAAACGDDGDNIETHIDDETPAAGETPAGGETPAAAATSAVIKMVPVIAFDKTELTIAADTEVSITADNEEAGVSHNFAVYESRDDAESGGTALAATEICNGPCTDTATVNLSAGEYFFRCEVHPTQMVGTLTVEKDLG